MGAGMHEFNGGKRTVRMHRVRHKPQRRNVAVVPETTLDIGGDIARWMNLHFLGADHRPAPLRLDAAHRRMSERLDMAHAIAVRYLKESVLGGDGAQPDGLEQNVVAGIARHLGIQTQQQSGDTGRFDFRFAIDGHEPFDMRAGGARLEFSERDARAHARAHFDRSGEANA